MEYSRNCPKCDSLIEYKTQGALNSSIHRGSKSCRRCSSKVAYEKRKANGNWNCTNKGLKIKGTQSEPKYWKLCPGDGCDELMGYTTLYMMKRNPTTECHKCNGKNPWNKGKSDVYSDTVLSKMRTSAINRIAEAKFNGGQVKPNYNRSSIPIIEAKANELGITDLQHAENGGEFHIKELGYFVDGYSKEKNIVIEYDEKHHKRHVDKDSKRQIEIEKHLNCKFIRIIEK